MRLSALLFAAAALAASAAASRAEDAMSGGMMASMQAGEVLAITPDGHMGTKKMMADDAMAMDMMKMAQPLKACTMFIAGSDGKAMMVDTSGADAMKACEKIAR